MKYRCVVSCPIDTYSGYGSRSRDFVKALLKKYPDWEIKALAQKWGSTREGFLKDHNLEELSNVTVYGIDYRPDIWIQITIPNEFQAVGTFNIGVTAGIETDRMDASWIEGCNRMSLILVSSEHSKKVIEDTKYNVLDNRGNLVKSLEISVPVDVLFEGVDLNVYTALDSFKPTLDLDQIVEREVLLVVGHWLQGDLWQDRKNIGGTIKSFLETFKNKPAPPALLLKVQSANASIQDRTNILAKIEQIKGTVKGKLPNVYLLHGELSDVQINELYNHPKVKAMVSLTKGEGFGRPLLEFSVVNKPIIATNWSGHLDFLKPEFTRLVNGALTPIHKSAQVDKLLIEGSRWFTADLADIGQAYLDIFKNYKDYLVKAKRQGFANRRDFSLEKMADKLENIVNQHLPKIPVQVEIKLPKLNKIQ